MRFGPTNENGRGVVSSAQPLDERENGENMEVTLTCREYQVTQRRKEKKTGPNQDQKRSKINYKKGSKEENFVSHKVSYQEEKTLKYRTRERERERERERDRESWKTS